MYFLAWILQYVEDGLHQELDFQRWIRAKTGIFNSEVLSIKWFSRK
jgi:hypothetical protein